MPTSTGLPKVGEVWEKQVSLRSGSGEPIRFVVIQRSRGDEWSMRVAYIVKRNGRKFWERRMWTDCAYGLQQGWYKFIHDASDEVKFHLGLGPAPTAKVSPEDLFTQLEAFLSEHTALATADPLIAPSMARRLIETGWVTSTPKLRRQP